MAIPLSIKNRSWKKSLLSNFKWRI